MAQIDQMTEDDFLLAVNAFWRFYCEQKHNYPMQFKLYLSHSKWFNRLTYVDLHDNWVLAPQSNIKSFSQKHLNF